MCISLLNSMITNLFSDKCTHFFFLGLCDLRMSKRTYILRTFIICICTEMISVHDLCKSLTMNSRLRFLYYPKIVSFTFQWSKDVISMEKKKESAIRKIRIMRRLKENE